MDENAKRAELKAKINEQLDELSLEDLEKVSGGGFWDILKQSGKQSWQKKAGGTLDTTKNISDNINKSAII